VPSSEAVSADAVVLFVYVLLVDSGIPLVWDGGLEVSPTVSIA
jgi:hypothetical protein